MKREIREIINQYNFWENIEGGRGGVKEKYNNVYFFVKHIILNVVIFLFTGSENHDKNNKKYKLICIALTANQKKAIDGWWGNVKITEKAIYGNSIESEIKHSRKKLAIFSLKEMWKTYILLKQNVGKNFNGKHFGQMVRYRAMKIIFIEVLNSYEPKYILISNDHSGESIAIKELAKNKNIKIIYTQHATVSTKFPALDFDLSMLDGIQAVDAYSKKENRGVIVVTGRINKHTIKSDENKIIKNIGIAVNELDSLKEWLNIVLDIKSIGGLRIKLRPHPADKRKLIWKKLSKLLRIEYDEGGINNFIVDNDLILTGLSGMVFEASLANKYVLMYLNDEKYLKYGDYYLYEKYKLCRIVRSKSEILSNIFNFERQKVSNALKFDAGIVVDPIKSKADVIHKFIETTDNSNEFNMNGSWEKVEKFDQCFWLPKEYKKAIIVDGGLKDEMQ